MGWRISRGARDATPVDYDGRIWQWELTSEEGDTARLAVKVTGTAMASDDEALAPRVVDAIATKGRSEVERVLASGARPPRAIEFHSLSHEPLVVGDGASDDLTTTSQAILDISDWFAERGLVLVVSQTAGAGTAVASVWEYNSAQESAPSMFLGATALEAAQRAREHYLATDEEVPRSRVAPSLPVASSHRRLRHAAPPQELLRQNGYRLLWRHPTDAADPVWMVEVYSDPGGELIEAGLGDNVDDALLGVIDLLRPDESGSVPGEG